MLKQVFYVQCTAAGLICSTVYTLCPQQRATDIGPLSTCLALGPFPTRSGSGFHLVLDWLEDHTKLALQTGKRVVWWDRQSKAL